MSPTYIQDRQLYYFCCICISILYGILIYDSFQGTNGQIYSCYFIFKKTYGSIPMDKTLCTYHRAPLLIEGVKF